MEFEKPNNSRGHLRKLPTVKQNWKVSFTERQYTYKNSCSSTYETKTFKQSTCQRYNQNGYMTLANVVISVFVICLLGMFCQAEATVTCPSQCVCVENQRGYFGTNNTSVLTAINCSALGLESLPMDIWLWENATYPNNISVVAEVGLLRNSTSVMKTNETKEMTLTIMQFLDVSYNNLETAMWPVLRPTANNTWWPEDQKLAIPVLEVNFSFNDINELGAEELLVYTHVRKLDLSNNNISKIHPDAFLQLQSLTELNLSHNKLSHLHEDTLRSLVNLQMLDLSHNLLVGDSINAILPVLSSLKYVYISDNQLSYARFPTLRHLQVLDVSANKLEEAPVFVKEGFSSLKTLRLSNNSIQKLDQDSFVGLHNLNNLYLDGNPLSNLTSTVSTSAENFPSPFKTPSVFSHMTQLKYLNLSNTPALHFIPPNIFTNLAKLEVLDLSNSGLSHISELTFHGLLQLNQIYLTGNPLNCSCINAWLADIPKNLMFANSSAFHNLESIQCLQEDGSQTSISSTARLCGEVFIHNISASVSTPLGSTLHLQCHITADEPAIIEWITPRGAHFHFQPFHQDATKHLLSPEDVEPGSPYHETHHWHHSTSYHSELVSASDQVLLLSDGSLFVDYMTRSDPGQYICRVRNANHNYTATVNVLLKYEINGEMKLYSLITGLICAASFFTLNLIYSMSSWLARKIVNKRRRETIRQCLESLNAYKSTQMTRIYENYSHQLNKVRNQYHIQRDKLHKNYSSQVIRVKRGYTHQVDRVCDNYHTKLTNLSEYTSHQILQIRERANNQVVRIRDYGSTQLDRLRENYKLQHQHVMKLLDTMNLDNCRHMIEAECMRTESMIFDIDLLGVDVDDDRTDSPMSSDYNTASSTPASSLPDDESTLAAEDATSQESEIFLVPPFAEEEMQSVFKPVDTGEGAEQSTFTLGMQNIYRDRHLHRSISENKHHKNHRKHRKRHQSCVLDRSLKPAVPLPIQVLAEYHGNTIPHVDCGDNASGVDSVDFVTPEDSPTKTWLENDKGISCFYIQEPSVKMTEDNGASCSVDLPDDFPGSPDTQL